MAKTNKKKVALGVGLGIATAAGALGAGYYFYGSKHAVGNRKRAAAWADDFKADVLRNAKKLKTFDERAYRVVVDEAMKAYQNVKSIDKADIRSMAAELKQNWKTIEREIGRVSKKESLVVKKAAKKAIKRVERVIPRKLVKKSAKKKQ